MKKKTHSQFLTEMKSANPSIIVLGSYENCSTKIEVKCAKCNHIWSAAPNTLIRGHGCPICAHNQKKSHQQFVSEMYRLNPYIEIMDEYKTALTLLRVRCTICGYEWDSKPNRLLQGAQCTNCVKPHTSFMEQFILIAFQDVVGKDLVESRNTSAIGLELDVYIPKYRFAIEPGTWLYHKDKVATYDLEKRNKCKDAGIRLITIYDTYPSEMAPPYDFDCYVFDGFLNEPGYERIIALIKELMASVNLDYSNVDWLNIANKAYAACHYNAHETFIMALADVQPNIEVLEEYKGTNIPITVNNRTCAHSPWNARPYTLLKGIGCPDCGKIIASKTRTRTAQQFKNEMAQIAPTIEIIGSYTKVTDRVDVRCIKCNHIWKPVAYSLLSGKGCPHCSAIKGAKTRGNKLAAKTTDQFREELATKNKNIIVLGEYINNKTKLLAECRVCGNKWEVVPASLLNGHGCPICSRKKR